MSTAKRPATNRLLSKLPAKDRTRFLAACVPIDLAFAHVVSQAGDTIPHVYFPTGGYISFLRPINGHVIEVAIAGDEGMFGWSLSAGIHKSNVQALVQGAGTALRLSARSFQRQLSMSAPLRKTIGRYAHVLMTQFAQTVGCNRFHVVEQRLARWLLMTADRAHSDSFRITQQFLANMLGVRRAGVNKAAGQLQGRGLIQYRRGNIVILDRAGLEQSSCECYKVNVETYNSVMG